MRAIVFCVALAGVTHSAFCDESKTSPATRISVETRTHDSTVAIGASIPDLRFKDIRALSRSLSEMGPHDAYVIVFTTTSCPLVKQTLPKLVELQRELIEHDIQFVAVNVGANDTIRHMAAQSIDLDVHFPFVKDTDLTCVRELGVRRTPEVVVLDHELKLRYRGRVDDQLRLGGSRPEPTRHDLKEALLEVLAGKDVTKPETPVDGCLISESPMRVSDIQPVFYGQVDAALSRRCVQCHRPESSAPFSLLSFEDASANARMIAEVVQDQTMPPWFATEAHGDFQNNPSLSLAERTLLLQWVQSGCREGDVAKATPVPEVPSGKWRIGEPDLVITMLEEHTVPATGFVPYRYTVLPYLFLQDTWVEAFEIRPENPAVVHHCNMAYMTKDGASEETFLTGYVPGGQPLDLGRFDNGTACFVPAGSGLGLQIHYTTTGKEETSRIQVGLRFPRSPVKKQFRHFLLDPRGWQIPPNDPAFRIQASHTLSHDVTLMGLFTHMHVRGRDMTFYAVSSDNKRETLLQIANYNFEWQLGYEIEPGKKQLSAGTKIEAIAHFDNSAFNPYNPDSKSSVQYGPQTIHEMFNGFVFYVQNDESLNIEVDSATGRVKSP